MLFLDDCLPRVNHSVDNQVHIHSAWFALVGHIEPASVNLRGDTLEIHRNN